MNQLILHDKSTIFAGQGGAARRAIGISAEQIEAVIGPRTMLGRAPRLGQVAQSIASLASDRAAGIAGTALNVTCGLVPGP